jgi:shikimate dehydrogenase
VIVDPPNTLLIRTARDRGCMVLDGMGMVVNQAVIAFQYWTGVDANAKVMRGALREVVGLG